MKYEKPNIDRWRPPEDRGKEDGGKKGDTGTSNRVHGCVCRIQTRRKQERDEERNTYVLAEEKCSLGWNILLPCGLVQHS